MRPASDAFLHALRGSHVVATRCMLEFPGEPLVEVPIQGGGVTIDRTAMIRRTGQVVIPWSLRVGLDLGLDLRTLPLGGYCHLFRGVRFDADQVELCRLGKFRVESVTWRTSDESASLELADQMAQVRDEPFLAPYTPVVLTPVTQNGTLSDNSPVVTGLASTAALIPGMIVSGLGVLPGTKLLSIDSPTQVTLSQPVNTHAVKSTLVVATSDQFEVSTTADLFVGMKMNSPGFYSNATVVEILSSTRGRSSRSWHSEAFWQETTYTLPALASLTFAGTVLIADAALEVTQAVFGDTISYQKLYEPAVVLGDVFYSGSRGDALQALALAASADVYFDADGNWIFTRPAGDSDPVWRVDASEDGVMIGADESLSRTGVYNGVLVQGQNAATDAPLAALVVNDEPTSPTRWGGPFGKVARVEQSSSVQTVEQAEQAAQSLLDRRLTLQRSLSVTAAPNPALEAGDVITVAFPDGREEDHVIDVVRIGLTPVDAQSFALQAVAPPDATQLTPRRRYGVFYGAQAWRELNRARLVSA